MAIILEKIISNKTKWTNAILILGAGFAGLQLAQHLNENLFEVLIIDKVNHHQFQPLFYQVATSQIERSSISFPKRNVLKNKKNVQVRLAEFHFIDNQQNQIQTSNSFTQMCTHNPKQGILSTQLYDCNLYSHQKSYCRLQMKMHIGW